jgi:uncharacterized protein (TIGR02646 family)
MKRVVKANSPKELLDWVESYRQDDGTYHGNCQYDFLDKNEKQIVRKSLLEEQGFLCCYTGHSIDEESSHIEHIKARSLSKSEKNLLETLDYNNLLAAYPHNPRRYLKETQCEYGAQARYDNPIFVTPLMEDCELRFKFGVSGKIEAVDSNDTAADDTIKTLKLDHSRLKTLREQVIDEAIFYQLSLLDAEERITYLNQLVSVMNERDAQNRLRQFCFVIKYVAQDLLSEG